MRKAIDVLGELEKSGDLKLLQEAGMLPSKVLYHLAIYNYVRTKRSSGVSASTAVTWAEDTFQCSRRTVYNAISTFE